MTDKKENCWIKFVPSLNLPKERVSIAYDTHDERGIRYAYGYFQFYNGTCGCFWKDGNEQPKVVKAEDIKFWMPVPSLDVQEEPVSEDLEAAIDTYLATYFGGEKEKQEWPFLKKMAIHFAEWQKQKDANLIFNAKEDGYRLGLATMKQQIMKEAVEVPIEEAVPFGSCKWKLCAKLWLDKGVKGNKVKLIIIKEDCI